MVYMYNCWLYHLFSFLFECSFLKSISWLPFRMFCLNSRLNFSYMYFGNIDFHHTRLYVVMVCLVDLYIKTHPLVEWDFILVSSLSNKCFWKKFLGRIIVKFADYNAHVCIGSALLHVFEEHFISLLSQVDNRYFMKTTFYLHKEY